MNLVVAVLSLILALILTALGLRDLLAWVRG